MSSSIKQKEAFIDWVCKMVDCPFNEGLLDRIPDDVAGDICEAVEIHHSDCPSEWSCVPYENDDVPRCWKKLYEYLWSISPGGVDGIFSPAPDGSFVEWFCDHLRVEMSLCPREVGLLDNVSSGIANEVCVWYRDIHSDEWECAADSDGAFRCWAKLWEHIGWDETQRP